MSESGNDTLELATLNRFEYTAKLFNLDCAIIYTTEEQLVKDAINALLGIPSKAFLYQDDKSVILYLITILQYDTIHTNVSI